MIVSQAVWSDLTPATAHGILQLRCAVFVVEQNCAYLDIDGRDVEPGTQHLWMSDHGEVSVCLRILREPHGVRIGRVVTRKSHRGLGLAAALIGAALDWISDAGLAPIVLDAQSHLAGWYTGFGFSISGAEFVEDGIPHVPMALHP